MAADKNTLEQILKADPIWSAYALADLEPEHQKFCTWHTAGTALTLIYRGMEPPVLFTLGRPQDLAVMLAEVPEGRYQLTCLPAHLDPINSFLQTEALVDMWRMVFVKPRKQLLVGDAVPTRLRDRNLSDIQMLFRDKAEAPDAFLPAQLNSGVFYGIYQQSHLVAVAGTHVLSHRYKLAAIGNVFTDPAYRGKGFASLATQAVVNELISERIANIVLNVAQSNTAAIKAYKRVGFEVHCDYFEGYGTRVKR
jgi:ribosomal protein S18 acetylase RimI-like enzyme